MVRSEKIAVRVLCILRNFKVIFKVIFSNQEPEGHKHKDLSLPFFFPSENFQEMVLKSQGNAVTYHTVTVKAAMEAPTRFTGSPHSAADLFSNRTQL